MVGVGVTRFKVEGARVEVEADVEVITVVEIYVGDSMGVEKAAVGPGVVSGELQVGESLKNQIASMIHTMPIAASLPLIPFIYENLVYSRIKINRRLEPFEG